MGRRKRSTQEPNFHLFKEFPPEIRVMIWKSAMPDSRYIELVEISLPNDPQVKYALYCIEQAPALFDVCRESRAEARKKYSPFRINVGDPIIYCNFDRDFLTYAGNCGTLCSWSPPKSLRKKVMRIATTPTNLHLSSREGCCKRDDAFENLEEILVSHDLRTDWEKRLCITEIIDPLRTSPRVALRTKLTDRQERNLAEKREKLEQHGIELRYRKGLFVGKKKKKS